VGRETNVRKSRGSLRSEGATEMVTRRPVRSRLHMTAAHWYAPKSVAQCNSLVYPLDYVLNQSVNWLRVFKTL
jgi:hypothetical protein